MKTSNAKTEAQGGKASESTDVKDNELVLGIDGGGSKTQAWLARPGVDGSPSIVGRGESGGSNPQAAGFGAACESLDQAIEAAFQNAGTPRRSARVACLAVAGAGRVGDQQRLQQWATEQQVAAQTLIVHDAQPVLAAGTPAGWGIALIAGTGSLAYGRSAQGVEERVGGWGPTFGDEGSGYTIGCEALRAAARCADGRGPDTQLLPRLLQRLDCREPAELIPAVYQGLADRAALATLAADVFAAADEGDEESARIIWEAAAQLAEMVQALVKKLGLPRRRFPLALTGGLLQHHASYRDQLLDALGQRELQPTPLRTVAEPVLGTVLLALHAAEKLE